jgi:ABC-type lipoprotein release transport system permease subunit
VSFSLENRGNLLAPGAPSALAAIIPARRAAKLDPAQVLNAEV